jgi:hypothetical protein
MHQIPANRSHNREQVACQWRLLLSRSAAKVPYISKIGNQGPPFAMAPILRSVGRMECF